LGSRLQTLPDKDKNKNSQKTVLNVSARMSLFFFPTIKLLYMVYILCKATLWWGKRKGSIYYVKQLYGGKKEKGDPRTFEVNTVAGDRATVGDATLTPKP
jgi:hypothetical protein